MIKKIAVAAMLVAAMGAAQAETWRVSMEPTFAPFEFKDAKTGEMVGFDVDVIKAVGKAAGVEVQIQPMGFDAIIPAIISHTTDVGISGFTITEERAKKVQFTEPYYDAGLSIMVRKEDAKVLKDVDALKGRILCVQIGTSGAERAKQVPGAKLRQFNTMPETYLELGNRGCEAIIADRPVHGYFMASSPRKAKVFTHLPQLLQPEQYGIVTAKDRPEITSKVNKGLAAIRSDGTYAKIFKKWFGE
ncbi:MAG: basic amino acid ABC transporter substrate-binding protein [Duodenibacillus sp.]|nr:basic amino acid ABC transporter substrate-binding protein [Duodenibacillus sp.]